MGSAVITLDGIERHFKLGGEVIKALDGITLVIDKNEYVALMGHSGSGKSTLMNLIGCLDTPTAGKYLLEDVDVRNLSDNELAHIRNSRIGFIFQTFKCQAKEYAPGTGCSANGVKFQGHLSSFCKKSRVSQKIRL